MNHTKKVLSFLISIPLLISTLTFSASAESSFEDFNFEWTDMSTIDDSIIEYMNEEAEYYDPEYCFTVTKNDFCGQLSGYAFDYNCLTTSLSNYKSGSIKNYIKKSGRHLLFSKKNNYSYCYMVYPPTNYNPLRGSSDYDENDQNYYSTIGDFLDYALPFNLKGDVYFVHDQFFLGTDIAIVEVNDTPKYVVFMDSFPGLATDRKLGPDEKRLYDTYDYISPWSLCVNTDTYNEEYNHQGVFDFDFIVDLCKSDAGTLPDDYKYVPKGLEKGMLEKYRSCVSKSEYDGIVYYYNKLGECKGAYTGWAEGAYGKKYYRDGIALTGAQRIDRKKYHFDDNGVLIEEK